jgi:hypothetical protein
LVAHEIGDFQRDTPDVEHRNVCQCPWHRCHGPSNAGSISRHDSRSEIVGMRSAYTKSANDPSSSNARVVPARPRLLFLRPRCDGLTGSGSRDRR